MCPIFIMPHVFLSHALGHLSPDKSCYVSFLYRLWYHHMGSFLWSWLTQGFTSLATNLLPFWYFSSDSFQVSWQHGFPLVMSSSIVGLLSCWRTTLRSSRTLWNYHVFPYRDTICPDFRRLAHFSPNSFLTIFPRFVAFRDSPSWSHPFNATTP